ncbi:ADP-ribose pyrophosphatase YjhB (NUDIX family) [Saccharopolyspora erythraea NRRL 2338]|uniref:NUDIX hydrolase n=2 Tax=Saccharopolyspora erythraea TaxID=1836 RepID=A4F9B7_SACEN|nr:NUDIX domain-containing protein [Saccharopolyspora erythraea]EQD86584.1 DNA mismatch repair protein MutT [Saccharopolyspora erythraea D]PFG94430.1 ADP-ribose pyrophosphatase YjhB (NUDIX family) [Saccharopolyspora erythraea NRRL 2338]QRK91191.1 NUDIX domain-containing protein [Saccharopolyspora erythraea]CAM00642.1 NUDIX hydrolase [Saccharopolyspora erythraea NRRL 2338]
MPHRTIIDAHLLLVRGGEVLLSLRRGRYGDGMWHLPSGKLDAGESVVAAAVREAREEVGVRIDPADLRHVHTLHATGPGQEPRLGVFFEATRWAGEPVNLEPEKCHGIEWFDLHRLPEPLIPYPAAGIHAYRDGIPFATMGWPPVE